MKKYILILSILFTTAAFSQPIVNTVYADTFKVAKRDGTPGEFVLKNSTRFTSGWFLKNIGDGKTAWAAVPSIDTTSLSNRINLKLNAADTASLSNRINLKLNAADTASLSNRINSKLSTAITTLNSLTSSTQSFAFASSGTTPNISSSTSTHTFNFPLADSLVTSGLVSNGTQSLFGRKTLKNSSGQGITLRVISNKDGTNAINQSFTSNSFDCGIVAIGKNGFSAFTIPNTANDVYGVLGSAWNDYGLGTSIGVYGYANTVNTSAIGCKVYIVGAAYAAGSSYGHYIDVTSSQTNNYGIYINSVTGATNNWGGLSKFRY
jgi:hypothetical protein